MAALPYMPLYAADYLADTAHLTTAQHGAYLLLLMNYWQRGGPLPDDDVRLARIARVGPREWGKMRGTISEFFSIAGGNWSHNRVDSELARVEAKSLKSKRAAQASVQQRFGERSTPVEPTDTDTREEKPTAIAVVKNGDPRGTRLPEDWEPKPLGDKTASMVAAWPVGMLERELSKFRDHFLKTPGVRGRSLDWDASYRNWLRTADERKPRLIHERSDRDPTTVALERLIGPHAGTG
jgi:uncharacterized protein YdaU (DUF1376 family)